MHLKLATQEHIPVLLEHAQKLHASGWPGVFQTSKAHEIIQGVVTGNPTENIALLCLQDDRVVGSVILTTFLPTWSDDLFVTELSLFVDPAHKRALVYLTDAAEEWGRRIGAKGISLGIKLGKRSWHNYNSCETTFMKEID